MRHARWWYICSLLLTVFLTACSEEDAETFPSLYTEFVCLHTNAQGEATHIVTDHGITYSIRNRVTELTPDSTYRLLCDYEKPQHGASQDVLIYQLQYVYSLADSTLCASADPVNVASVWLSGSYINMHLQPLTQGGTQYWGYCVDSTAARRLFLSLHHRQGADPASYTRSTYASLHTDSLDAIQQGDTITLNINTYQGLKQWNFVK